MSNLPKKKPIIKNHDNDDFKWIVTPGLSPIVGAFQGLYEKIYSPIANNAVRRRPWR